MAAAWRGASPVCVSVGGKVRVPTDDQIFIEFHSDGHKTSQSYCAASRENDTNTSRFWNPPQRWWRRQRWRASWSLLTELKRVRAVGCEGTEVHMSTRGSRWSGRKFGMQRAQAHFSSCTRGRARLTRSLSGVRERPGHITCPRQTTWLELVTVRT